MPIRFDSGDNNKGKGGGNLFGGSNNDTAKKAVGILAILGVIFFIFKKPKLFFSLVLIAGGVAGYFYWKDPEGFTQYWSSLFGDESGGGDSGGGRALGCNIDLDKYDRTEVFEPLASSSSKNSIPAAASLRQYAPRRKNQGQQGSCVGWASAYAARTILEASATGDDPNRVAFSPAFLYNQIRINNSCEGSYTSEALEKMKNDGLLFLSKFPYDENDCTNEPDGSQLQEAENYKIRGYNRLTQSGDDYDVDIEAVKQNIAQGGPVVIAFKVPPSFNYHQDKLWEPEGNEPRRVEEYGGHAMCLIGYDDNFSGGAFEVMNSWGDDWGNDGIFWIKYDDFHTFTREAYGIYPHQKKKTSAPNKIEVSFGLVEFESGENIALEKRDGKILFGTPEPIVANTKFQVEVTNSVECYTYIFGQETDGSSYVLFPYTAKHSPYCGIVGTRHFPKGQESLRADDLGNQDYMAIVVTKQPINYDAVNEEISNASGSRYDQQVLNGLRAAGIKINTTARFSTDGNVAGFKGDTNNGDAVAVVFEIDKE